MNLCCLFLWMVISILIVSCCDLIKSINSSFPYYILSIVIFIIGIIQFGVSFFFGFDSPYYFYSDRVERRKWGKRTICYWNDVVKCERKVLKRLPYSTICTYVLFLTTNNLKTFKIPLSRFLVYEIIREVCSNKDIVDSMDE